MSWLDMLAKQFGGASGAGAAPAMDNPFAAQQAYDNAQQDRQRALQMQQAQYQGGGGAGMLAGLLQMLGGKTLERKADETATQALARQFEFQTKAQQAAAEADARKAAEDEARAVRLAEAKERAKAKNRPKTEMDYLSEGERSRAARVKSGLELGAQAPQQARQPTALEIQLQLAQQQGATPDQMRQIILGNSGPQAPAGFRFKDDGTQEFIVGGPADPNRQQPVSGEQAARLAMADVFLKDAPQITKEIQEGGLTGPYDSAQAQLGYGRQGELARQIASGTDALLRNLTGAGMSETEAQKYAARYAPSRFDTEDSLASKVKQLTKELQAYQNKIGGNQAAAPGAPPAFDYQAVLAKHGL